METYRKELKYLISEIDAQLISKRLNEIATRDIHNNLGQNSYLVSSLYFDTPYNTNLALKNMGYNSRSKFRIRYYNNNLDLINLENKVSNEIGKYKRVQQLTLEEAQSIIDNTYIIQEDSAYLLKKFNLENMMPKVIIRYNREAFTYSIDNIRITIDKHILTSKDIEHFLRPGLNYNILPGNNIILEIKYKDILPDILRRALLLDKINNREAYSKYQMAMRYA